MNPQTLFNLIFKITIVLSIYTVTSCNINKQYFTSKDILGTYIYKPHKKAFSSRIQLHDNGEFILEQHLGSDKPSYNKGHWKILNNRIEINSIIQPFKQIQQIEDPNSTKIKVIDFRNNTPILFAKLEVRTNNNISKISESDFNGLAFLQFSDNDSVLIVNEIGYLQIEIPVNKIKGRMIEITLHEHGYYSYYITDEFWKVNLKKLKRTIIDHNGDKKTNIYTKK